MYVYGWLDFVPIACKQTIANHFAIMMFNLSLLTLIAVVFSTVELLWMIGLVVARRMGVLRIIASLRVIIPVQTGRARHVVGYSVTARDKAIAVCRVGIVAIGLSITVI